MEGRMRVVGAAVLYLAFILPDVCGSSRIFRERGWGVGPLRLWARWAFVRALLLHLPLLLAVPLCGQSCMLGLGNEVTVDF